MTGVGRAAACSANVRTHRCIWHECFRCAITVDTAILGCSEDIVRHPHLMGRWPPPCFPAMVCGRNDDSHAVLQRVTLDVSDLHCHLLQPKSHPTTQRPTQSLSYPATQTTIHSAIRHIMQPPTRLTPHPATQPTSHTASHPAINQATQFLATGHGHRSWPQVLTTGLDQRSRP